MHIFKHKLSIYYNVSKIITESESQNIHSLIISLNLNTHHDLPDSNRFKHLFFWTGSYAPKDRNSTGNGIKRPACTDLLVRIILSTDSSSPNLCIVLQCLVRRLLLFTLVSSLTWKQMLPYGKWMTDTRRLVITVFITFSDSRGKLNNLLCNSLISLTQNYKIGLCINSLLLLLRFRLCTSL